MPKLHHPRRKPPRGGSTADRARNWSKTFPRNWRPGPSHLAGRPHGSPAGAHAQAAVSRGIPPGGVRSPSPRAGPIKKPQPPAKVEELPPTPSPSNRGMKPQGSKARPIEDSEGEDSWPQGDPPSGNLSPCPQRLRRDYSYERVGPYLLLGVGAGEYFAQGGVSGTYGERGREPTGSCSYESFEEMMERGGGTGDQTILLPEAALPVRHG